MTKRMIDADKLLIRLSEIENNAIRYELEEKLKISTVICIIHDILAGNGEPQDLKKINVCCKSKPKFIHYETCDFINGEYVKTPTTRFECPECLYAYNWVTEFYSVKEMVDMWNNLIKQTKEIRCDKNKRYKQ